MGSPEVIHAHTRVLTGKRHQMSALFLQRFSMLEEIEWGHVTPPTASNPDGVQPSGRKPASPDSSCLGEMKPWDVSLTQPPCVGRRCPRAASSLVGGCYLGYSVVLNICFMGMQQVQGASKVLGGHDKSLPVS